MQSRRQRQLDNNRNIDSSNLNLNSLVDRNRTMPHEPDTIFKALRPVPDFDGNPNVLTRFIKICDQIVNAYLSTEPGSELSNLCLLNGILNKITGPAASIINSNGIPDNWLDVRNALINNFADQRDETALYNDLSLATQGQRSPQEFYDQCQTLFSTIMTYISLHETVATTIEAKRVLYRKLTMQAFVRGLQEPLGSRIRCMRPNTIEKALEYVQEELNIMYLQQRNDAVAKPHSAPKIQPAPVHILKPPPAPFWPAPAIHRPLPPPPQPFRFAPQPHQGFRANPMQGHHQPQQRAGPSRTQQMFGARPPNYNPNSNMFRLPPRNPPGHSFMPKPMSGIQHFTPKALPPTAGGLRGHDWRVHGNPPPTNYFKSREMNMNECYDASSYYGDCYNDSDYMLPQYSEYAVGYDCSDYACYDNQLEPQPYYDHSQSLDTVVDAEDYQASDDSQNFRKDQTLKKPK